MSESSGRIAEEAEQRTLLALALMTTLLAIIVGLPYLQFVILGLVFAYVLWPLQARLEPRTGASLAAITLSIASMFAIILPLVYILLLSFRQAQRIIKIFEQGNFDVAVIHTQLAELGLDIDITLLHDEQQKLIAQGTSEIVQGLINFARSLPNILIGLTISLFVLFVLLRDGNELLEWFRTTVPLREDIREEFLERLDRLMWASIVGNVAASGIQAIGLGLGLALLGFPNVIFLSVLTFMLALLPVVGAFVVWIPLVGYLVLVGQPTEAMILFFIGSVVSISDNYTRPLVIGHSAALNSAIIVLGIFGGIVTFGIVGLLIGPVILGSAKITIDILTRERIENREATGSQ